MEIYLSDRDCKYILCMLGYNNWFKHENMLGLEGVLDLLGGKDVFLIDVFHTFIEPVTTLDEQRTYERQGIEAFMKYRSPRAGFGDFVRHYQRLGKMIGIHTDSFSRQEFDNIRKGWDFDSHVDGHFGREYSICIAGTDMYDERNYIKDFGRMVQDMGAEKEKTLVIGDGRSDIMPSIYFGLDILLVPDYICNSEFDYNSFIPKK